MNDDTAPPCTYSHRREMIAFCLKHADKLTSFEARLVAGIRFHADLTDGRWKLLANVFETVRALVTRQALRGASRAWVYKQ